MEICSMKYYMCSFGCESVENTIILNMVTELLVKSIIGDRTGCQLKELRILLDAPS
jgi:hypothetical protein